MTRPPDTPVAAASVLDEVDDALSVSIGRCGRYRLTGSTQRR